MIVNIIIWFNRANTRLCVKNFDFDKRFKIKSRTVTE